MKRKLTITIEMEELVFFKTRKIFTGFCRVCEMTVELLTVEDAVLFLGLSAFQVFRLIETEMVHFIETEKDYVCRNSLEICAEILRSIKTEKDGEDVLTPPIKEASTSVLDEIIKKTVETKNWISIE